MSPTSSEEGGDERSSSRTASEGPPTPPAEQGSPAASPSQATQALVSAIVVGFKRPHNDDAAEASGRIARKLKLDSKDSELLAYASKMPLQEQLLFNIGLSLKTMTKANQIQPIDAKFVVPEKLKRKIDIYVYNALVCPQATGYLEEGNRIVLEILVSHPSWGLTPEVKDNPDHYQAVCTRVSNCFNDKRRHLKAAINKSLGTVNPENPEGHRLGATDIITLVTNATKARGSASMKSYSVKITVQMIARFAFLRRVLLELPKNGDYWKAVDKELLGIREQFNGRPKQAMSSFFKGILDDDLVVFGNNKTAHLDDIEGGAALTNAQTEVADAMAGIVTVASSTNESETTDSD
ncbi:hypothetical protein BC835DRAFT_1416293 [Cytidiella melzeri]|nr:hypothetical protein BC835DRAFT_1416293 [Cytidiella melzeri]